MNFREMNESQLKIFLKDYLASEFHIAAEVSGQHIVEKTQVIADFILRPKPHLVSQGFDDTYFAIEVKSPGYKDSHGKYRKAVVQAASYADSLFSGKRPMFTLIFPASEYFRPVNEEEILYSTEVHAYFNIAQYFNVGDFRILPDHEEWCIWFAGGRYFCSKRGRGPNNLTKRYTGGIK